MRFSVVGISHWKSGVPIRELFYLDKDRKKRLNQYTKQVPSGVLTLETCNRTEIFGFCEPKILVEALCRTIDIDSSFFGGKNSKDTLTFDCFITKSDRIYLK